MNRPKIMAIAAMTLDGKIAKDHNRRSDWTSKEDKNSMRKILKGADCVIVGRQTFELHKIELSKYNTLVLSRNLTDAGKTNIKQLNPQKESLGQFIENKGYNEIAVLGGQKVYTYFLKEDLLDELYIIIEPLIFGDGLTMFEGSGQTRFRLNSFKQLNRQGTLLLHYLRV